MDTRVTKHVSEKYLKNNFFTITNKKIASTENYFKTSGFSYTRNINSMWLGDTGMICGQFHEKLASQCDLCEVYDSVSNVY